jgi:nucleoside-triphosphatase THEP1
MITIITGDIRSGKTTLAQRLYSGTHTAGILAPGDQTDRQIIDLTSRESRPLIATPDCERTIVVGRYLIDRDTIDWANHTLLSATQDATVCTIILDEIGKLEVAGDGHAGVVPALAQWAKDDDRELVVVVRSELVAEVWELFFGGG